MSDITWHALMQVLRDAEDYKAVYAMLQAEKKGPNRFDWKKRMYHRYSALRQAYEMRELGLK